MTDIDYDLKRLLILIIMSNNQELILMYCFCSIQSIQHNKKHNILCVLLTTIILTIGKIKSSHVYFCSILTFILLT